MKRLVKKAETITYTLISTMIAHEYNNTTKEDLDYEITNSNFGYFSELSNYVNDDMSKMGPKGLAEYIDDDMQSIIDSIIVKIDGAKANAVVKANRKLTNEELNVVKDFIIGEYADGWGEGFEQGIIETYDIENENTHEWETIEVYVSFWGDITYRWQFN